MKACEELRPYLRREFGWPLTELGRIRFRRGDIQGAEEAFLAAHEAGWDPQPGLALVQLARGDVARAAASIREALGRRSTIPSKEWPPNTELRRAPLLEAQVEIEIAAGDLARARSAADELGQVASLFQSKALAASAALADARVRLAEGDAGGANSGFETAAHAWSDIGAPYETALARMGLGHALRAEGKEERALLEFRAARATFERIGAPHQEAGAARACGDVGPARPRPLPPSAAAHPADAAVFHREGDYWSIGFEGRTARVRDSRGLHYLARLLADPGREIYVLDLVALGRAGPDTPGGPLARAWLAMREMLASCSISTRKRHIAAGSPRSTKTSRKRGRWVTANGLRKRMRNANSHTGARPCSRTRGT